MAEDTYRLRVGIDFNQAKRDVTDFAGEARRQARQLTQNVNAAVKEALSVGAAGKSPEASRAAGEAIADIRRQADKVRKEIEKVFATPVKAKVIFADIDRIGGGKSANPRLTLSGEKISPSGLFVPALKQGFAAGTVAGNVSTAASRATGSAKVSGETSLIEITREAADAATKRRNAIRQSAANEIAYAKDTKGLLATIGEEAQLRRRRVAAERAAGARAIAPHIGEIAKADARTNFERDRLSARTAREESNLALLSPKGRELRDDRAATLAQDKLVSLKQSAANERELALRSAQIARLAAEELRLKSTRVAAQKRARAEFFAGDSTEANQVRGDTAATNAANAKNKLALERETQEILGTAHQVERGKDLQAQKVRALQRELVVIRGHLGEQAQAGDLVEDFVKLQAQVNAATAQLRNRVKNASDAAFRAQGLIVPTGREVPAGPRGTPSLFQRGYAGLHSRAGGSPVDALASPRLGQFLGQRALSTVGFGITGGLLYGAVSQVRELITEAAELEVQFGLVRGMFQEVYGASQQATEGFDRFSDSVIKTARDTATSASVVADIARQLSGSFADPETGEPDFEKGASEANVAVQLARVTKLPEQEINDSLTAVALAFDESFRDISDGIIGLSTQYGVSATEIVQFTADLAPVAKALGFTSDQLSALGAVSQQRTGQSGASLAEQFRRVLPTIQEARGEIVGLVDGFDKSGKAAGNIAEAFANNQIDQVLRQIILTYSELDKTQQGVFANQIASLVGGRREAGALFALLDGGKGALRALDVEGGQFGGALEDRMANLRKGVTFAFDEMERAVEEFGKKLYEAGLAEALVSFARALATIADLAGDLIGLFSGFNNALNGIPGQILLIVTAMKAFQVAYKAIVALRATETAVSVLGAPTGRLNPLAAGGLLSAYQGPVPVPAGQAGPPAPGGFKKSITSQPQLARLAATGRAGTIAAGAVSFAAPLGAAVLALEANNKRNQVQGDLDAQEAELVGKIDEALAKGDTSAQIRGRAVAAGGGKISDGGYTILGGIGRFLLNEKTPLDVVDERLGVVDADVNKEKLRALDASLEGRQRSTQGYTDKDAEVGQLRADITNIIADIEADPSDYDTEAAIRILEVATATDLELQKLFGAIDKNARDNVIAAQKAKDAIEDQVSGKTQLDTATALSIYEQGGSDIAPVLAAMDADIKGTQEIVDANPNDYAQLKLLLEKKAARTQVIRQAYEKEAELSGRLATLSGTDSPEAAVTAAASSLANIQGIDGASQDAIFEASFALAEAEQNAFLDRVSQTEDLAERLRLLEGGFEYSPEAQAALLAIQVASQGGGEELAAAADALGLSVSELSQSVLDVINEYGGGASDIVRSMLVARANELRAAANSPAVARNRTAREELRGLASAAAKAVTDLPEFDFQATQGAPPREIVDRTREELAADNLRKQKEAEAAAEKARREAEAAAREAERKAEEARREAQAQANANLDVEAARQDGNSLELAQIARRRAQIAIAFAQTGSERTAAFAQLIEADNQIRDAFIAQVQAQRDLVVAQNNDDPLRAAGAAVAAAQDAVNIARGAEAKATAQAALLRAQRDQRDALFDLADAQTDILIASADAAGDTVEASKLSLAKINRQLSRNDLNAIDRAGLEAERITAEAGVRDATLSAEQATIQYQLEIGDITKQQAVGALQSLLTIPNLTETQIREINLEILRLRQSLGADFQYNLPTQLGLPTVYEVRRLGQSGGTGAGYQDNRVIDVTVNVATDASADDIANAVATVVGEPNRTGTIAKRF